MMSGSPINLYLAECKVQASQLLKSLTSAGKNIQTGVYWRIQILPEFQDKTIAQSIIEELVIKLESYMEQLQENLPNTDFSKEESIENLNAYLSDCYMFKRLV